MSIICSTDFLYSVLRVTTPIMFAAMAALIANTAGIANIAIEGTMLIASFVGMLVSSVTANAWIGLSAALFSGLVTASVLAFFTLYYRTNVILGGIAINSLASGGTVFFLYLITHDKGTSASMTSMVIPQFEIPLIRSIPILGNIISGHNILTYVSVFSVIAVSVMLKRTPLGFRFRAVGEDQNAAESVGIHVIKTKVQAILLSGLLCGFGGAFMSMGYVSWFSRDMVAGRGWIAIAAQAMGGSSTLGTAATSVLFGFFDAFSNAAGMLGWPSDLVRTIPYCATLIGLYIFSMKNYKKKRV